LKNLSFSGSQKFKKLTKTEERMKTLLSTKKPKKSLDKAFRLKNNNFQPLQYTAPCYSRMFLHTSSSSFSHCLDSKKVHWITGDSSTELFILRYKKILQKYAHTPEKLIWERKVPIIHNKNTSILSRRSHANTFFYCRRGYSLIFFSSLLHDKKKLKSTKLWSTVITKLQSK